MEKRALIAIALSALILFVWFKLFPPPERQPAPTPAETTSAVEAEPRAEESVEPEPPAPEPERDEGVLEADRISAEAEEEIRLGNRYFDVVLTNRGGRVLSWKLREYTTPDGQPLELLPGFHEDEHWFLAVDHDDPALAKQINDALYRVERATIHGGEGGSGESVTFTWSDGRGLAVTKKLEVREESPLVDVSLEVTDRGRRLPARLALGPGFGAQEPAEGRSNYYYSGQAVWDRAGVVTRIRPRRLKEPTAERGGVRWAGLEDQYFAALLVPEGESGPLVWRPVQLTPLPPPGEAAEPDDEAKPVHKPIFSMTLPPEGAKLYIGPKKYTLLSKLGHDLEQSVWFSSYSWLRPIVRSLFLALLWIHDRITGNYGLAIILATLVLRIILFPINQYSMVKMKKSQLQMQKLQPKVKAIRAKYKKKDAKSRAAMNQEMMALYKREGINPVGGVSGCLPMLAQFPVLIGFYNMLTVAVELRAAPFVGWIQDLSREDPYWITPLLMGATMFLQQRMAMSRIKDPQQLQQQRIMLFMPVMFTVICLNMPSGLVLYWFVNNLLGIGQQWLVNRHTGRLEAPAPKGKKAKA